MTTSIFIAGFGRSGTTPLRDALGSHPDIYAMPYELRFLTDPDGILSLESALIDNWSLWQSDIAIKRFKLLMKNLGSKYTGTYALSNFKAIFRDSYQSSIDHYVDNLVTFQYRGVWAGIATLFNKSLMRAFHHKPNILNSETIYYCAPLTPDEFCTHTRKFFNDIFADRLRRDGKKIWLVHEPMMTFSLPRLQRYFPDGKFIVVMRDPRDVAASLQHRDWGPKSLEQVAIWQRDCYLKWFEVKKNLQPSSYYELKFEEWVQSPAQTIENISKYLDINVKSVMNNFDLSAAHAGRWRNQFTPGQADLMQSILGDVLKRFGYQ